MRSSLSRFSIVGFLALFLFSPFWTPTIPNLLSLGIGTLTGAIGVIIEAFARPLSRRVINLLARRQERLREHRFTRFLYNLVEIELSATMEERWDKKTKEEIYRGSSRNVQERIDETKWEAYLFAGGAFVAFISFVSYPLYLLVLAIAGSYIFTTFWFMGFMFLISGVLMIAFLLEAANRRKVFLKIEEASHRVR